MPNAPGCSDTSYYTIGVNPPLVITTSQTSSMTCISSNFPKFSNPVTLTASGAASYVWFPYNPSVPFLGPTYVVRPSANTCYTVTGSTAMCSGSAVVCVSVKPQFSFTITPNAPTICNGDVLQLKIGSVGVLAIGPPSAFTYNWTEPINSLNTLTSLLSPTVNAFPQSTATYTAEIRDATGCLSLPEAVTVSVSACTGLDKNNSEVDAFLIFPNPVNDKVYIQTDKSQETVIEVTDVLGKIILKESKNIPGNEIQSFNFNNFPSGIYFMTIYSSGKKSQTTKIIKE